MRRFLKLVLAHFPTLLPQTPDAHFRWVNDILDLGGFEKTDSNVERISTATLHLDNKIPTDRVPKMYFVKSLRRDITNQISYSVIMGFKQQQKAASVENGQQVSEIKEDLG